MATSTPTKGSVANEIIQKFLEKHPMPDGKKRYDKGSKEDNAFLEMYRDQCGNEIHTNRGNVYRNSKETPDRLDQHARWHLGKVVDRMNNPKPTRATATKGETEKTTTQTAEHSTGRKQTGTKRKAKRKVA